MKTEKNKILDSLIEEVNNIDEEDLNTTDFSKEDVIDFLKDNPNPNYEIVHDWAESQGFDKRELEAMLYELATSYVRGL